MPVGDGIKGAGINANAHGGALAGLSRIGEADQIDKDRQYLYFVSMHISLTPRLEAFVKSRVESGLYNNASEVIREALRTEMEREPEMDPAYVAWVNSELDKGLKELEEGKGIPYDPEIFAERRAKRRAAKAADHKDQS